MFFVVAIFAIDPEHLYLNETTRLSPKNRQLETLPFDSFGTSASCFSVLSYLDRWFSLDAL